MKVRFPLVANGTAVLRVFVSEKDEQREREGGGIKIKF